MRVWTRNALRLLEQNRHVHDERHERSVQSAHQRWSVLTPARVYRVYGLWQRAVSALVALTLFAGPLSITFEQSRDAAGVLAAGSTRLDDEAWQQIQDLAGLRVHFTMQEAQAAPIVDPTAPISFQPKITRSTGANGGVPVVNITAPNAAGISLNQYQSFNIDPVGLILNNSLMSGTSLTGGDVQANPNLSGRTASVIVNQVTSTGAAFASLLNGPLEVFGAPATVIIANPNGITTHGTGFTNTIGVTLSTGTPQFLSDLKGSVTDFNNAQAIGYSVTGGHIQIEGNAGVNGPGAGIEGTVGTIDLIGETIGINAPLYAGQRINAIAGRQFVLPSAVTASGTTYATSSNGADNTANAINSTNGRANNGLAIDATAFGDDRGPDPGDRHSGGHGRAHRCTDGREHRRPVALVERRSHCERFRRATAGNLAGKWQCVDDRCSRRRHRLHHQCEWRCDLERQDPERRQARGECWRQRERGEHAIERRCRDQRWCQCHAWRRADGGRTFG